MRTFERTLELFARWAFDERGLSVATRRKYVQRVRQADRWLRAERGASVIWAKPKDLKAFLFSTSATARNRNAIRQALVAFGAFLVDQGWVETNHALALPRLPEPPHRPQALTVEQGRRIVAASRALSPGDRALVLLYLYGGLRNAEGRCLEWAHVDEDARWLRFRGKGGKVREVPLHEVARAALLEVRRDHRDARWVFPSPLPTRDEPVSETYVRNLLHQVGEMVGLPRLHPHQLRHTMATRLIERSWDVRDVQEFLGHSSPQTTAIYTYIRPARLAKAAASLDFERETVEA